MTTVLRLHMTFGRLIGHDTDSSIADFITALPTLLNSQRQCNSDARITVYPVPQADDMSLSLDCAIVVLDQPVMLGVPSSAAATAALLVWMASLRRLGEGPLQVAWSAYCRQLWGPQTPVTDVPIYLQKYLVLPKDNDA
jgi:hypothetical protein